MTRTIKTSLRRYRHRTASTLLLLCGVSAAVPVLPGAISIDFAGTGTAMGAAETAGVVAKSNWNVASGASSASPLKLKDDTGALTNTTVSWKADNGWATPVTDQAGNYRMMKGYLDNGSGNPTTVTLSGLSSGKYDIYVYTDGDNATYSHSGVYQLSGSGITTSSVTATDAPSANFSGTFIRANNSNGNYVLFSGVTVSSGFSITATPGATDSAPRAPLNGIQIIPTSLATSDFSIAAPSSAQTVAAGHSASYAITIGALNGFTGTVTLAASGLPSGTTASFSPASVTGSGTSTMTVTTTGSTPAGTSTVTVKGTSGSLTHTATTSLAVTATTAATAISINFPGTATLMGAAESAGVVAKTNWNNASGAKSTSALTLVDEKGASTGATATWTSDDAWATGIADQAGNNRMMKGYLDNGSGNPSKITVAGLVPGTYSVYVYADGDNAGSTRTGAYQISGSGITTTSINLTDGANTNFAGSFAKGNNGTGNYILFSNVTISSGFTLTATPGASPDNPRAPVNGIQIIPSSPSSGGTNQAPTVSAGANQTITLPATASLTGTASDDGLPNGTLTYTWTTVSGPGTVTFANANALQTSASFPAAGTYVLSLAASDSALSGSAQTTITVNPASGSGSGGGGTSPTADVVYPTNGGIFNVKNYGAKGDGVTDDTKAIQATITATMAAQGNIVYFPAGTYIISSTIWEKNGDGSWADGLHLQGQNQANTTIKLANNASGFGDGSCDASYESGSGCPAMLYSSTATRDGGWPNGAGEGGYWNDIFDLTLDTGSGNAGAVAIDWNCSNTAAIRNVTIKGSGRVGLNTSRGAGGGGNGPALVKNLTINGSFDYGIVAGSGEVGLTFEHIFITNPKTAGFWNTNQNIWIRDLEVTASGNVPAILNQNNSNLSVIDSSFTGSGTSAIQNSAWLYARNIQTSGYASAIAGVTGTSVNEYSSTSVVKLTSAASGNSLRLPIRETPAPFTDNNFSNWAIVQNTGGDSTAAIQSALNSGKATVYFPPVATYNISGTLHIPSGVRRLLGAVSAFNAPNGPAIIECDSTSGGPVEIRSFSFAGSINIVNKCGVPLVIADVFNLNGYSNVAGSGLEVYFENAAIPGDGVIQHGGNAWARQLDVETNNTHGTTDGGNFWVLGFKTEGTGENGNGMWYTTNQGSTEIIGAFDSTPGAGNWTGYQTIDSFISISGLSAGSGLTTPLMEKHNGAVSTYSNNGVRFGGTAVPLYSGK